MLSQGVRIVALFLRDIAQRILKLSAIEQPAFKDGLEKTLDRGGIGVRGRELGHAIRKSVGDGSPARSASKGKRAATYERLRLLAADLRLEDMLESSHNFIVDLLDFLIRQCAVLRLVGQGIGETLVPGGNAFAPVQIE